MVIYSQYHTLTYMSVYMCVCVYTHVCACKNKCMHICVCASVCFKYQTFIHFIRPSLLTAFQAAELLLTLAVETTSILREGRAPSLSSLRLLVLRPHLPGLFFALCVCPPYKEGYPYPHSGGHGAVREMLDSEKTQASCRTPWPSEQLL